MQSRRKDNIISNMQQRLNEPNKNDFPLLEQRDRWILEIRLRREQTAQQRQQLKVKQRETFDRQFYQDILGQNTDSFFKRTDQRFDGLTQQLRQNYPQITDKELQLLLLYLLDISDNDICTILEYTPNSLPTIKNRLSKKLKLKRASDIHNFIISLLKNNPKKD